MKFVLCPEGYRTCLSQSRFLLFFSSPSRLLLVSVSSPSAIFFYQMVFANFLTFSHFYAPIVRPFACRKFSIALPIKKPAGDTVHTPPPPVLKVRYNSFRKTTNSICFDPEVLGFAFFCCGYAIAFSLWKTDRLGIRTKKRMI